MKRIAASALSDIAKHTPELAQAVVDAGAVAYLAPLVLNLDARIKRQVDDYRMIYSIGTSLRILSSGRCNTNATQTKLLFSFCPRRFHLVSWQADGRLLFL